MKYIVNTDKSVEQAVADVEAACQDHQFGVLHVHNMQQTMRNKGVEFTNACHVMEVCNPHKAKAVLSADMEMNLALPCRISVYSQDGQTKIGMLRPKALLSVLSDLPELAAIAEDVEETMISIIGQAK
ncbi:MAG: DUF302 domain-containing protein [Planctomycetes bacterium]|nr:DUF302 domain-containing protein [Planctomycetota bacterium]